MSRFFVRRFLLPILVILIVLPLTVSQTFSSQPLDIKGNPDDTFTGGITRADFNQDGNLDIVAVGGDSLTDIGILLGDGHGNFKKSVMHVGCCDLIYPVVVDFNGDSHPDLLVADRENETLFIFYLFLGDGDGTFRAPRNLLHGNIGDVTAVLTADFDRDGKPDIAIANGKSVLFLYGDGKGNFPREARTPSVGGSLEESIFNIEARDVDNDGDPDLLVTVCCHNFPVQVFEVDLFRNNRKGALTIEPLFQRAIGQFKAAWADINQDGLLDLATVDNFHCDASQCRDLGVTFNPLVSKDRIQTKLPDPADYAFDSLAYSLAPVAADFNNDGYIDEAYALFAERPDFADFQALAVTRQNVDGSFAPPVSLFSPNSFFATPMLTGDFDNDGRIDILRGANISFNTTESAPTCPASALRTVHICLPENNARLPAPVQILATPHSGSPILAMKIYVDGVAQVSTIDERISTRLNLTAGVHRITVKAWDRQGPFSSTTTLNVNRNSLCTASADRTVNICIPNSDFPENGLTFRVLAGLRSSKGVQAAQVYLDGSLVYSAPSGRYFVDRSFQSTKGPHRLTVKGWDVNGAFSSSMNLVLP